MSSDRKAIFVARSVVLTIVIILLVMVACGGPELPSRVEITAKEWGVAPQPSVVKAGKVTFVVKNEGALEHNFIIEGVDEKIDLILQQETKTLEVTLKPGTYQILCNLPGHQEAGMVSQITVK